MNNQPTPAAMRAVASVFDRFFNIPAKATPDELAFLIDAELSQERERARELEACVASLLIWAETAARDWRVLPDGPLSNDITQARAILAKLRTDREGSK